MKIKSQVDIKFEIFIYSNITSLQSWFNWTYLISYSCGSFLAQNIEKKKNSSILEIFFMLRYFFKDRIFMLYDKTIKFYYF